MPHIILELSDNIKVTQLTQLLSEIQQVLIEMLPTRLESCKSRVIKYQDFLVGDGKSKNAFVHLSIKVLAGRTRETLNLVAAKLLSILPSYFKEASVTLKINISIAINNLPEVYEQVTLDSDNN